MTQCDHKFVDSRVCLKCGVSIGALRAASAAELERLLAASDIPEKSSFTAHGRSSLGRECFGVGDTPEEAIADALGSVVPAKLIEQVRVHGERAVVERQIAAVLDDEPAESSDIGPEIMREFLPAPAAPDPLDVRGKDGVSERWKRQFIPPEVRALADSVLASRFGGRRPSSRALADEARAARYPKLDAVWRPVVAWATLRAPELARVTFGPDWLQLVFALGPLSTSLMLSAAQVTQAVGAEQWQERLEHTLLQLRVGRARHEVKPESIDERDARARRQRAEQDDT